MKSIRILLSMVVVSLVILSTYNANATKWIITVQSFSFTPANLPDVMVGDTIRWVWVNGSHTTTSTTIPGEAAAWDHPLNSSNTFFEYPVTIAGIYNFKCTPHQSMGMVGSFTVNLETGITGQVSEIVRIYPNPANRFFFVENASGADVTIFNVNGENMRSQKIVSSKQAFDISQIVQGIYMVRIRINGDDRIEKLLIN